MGVRASGSTWFCTMRKKEGGSGVTGADMSFDLSGLTLQRPSEAQLAIPMSATILLAPVQYIVVDCARRLHSLARTRTPCYLRCRVGCSQKRATEAPNQLPTRSCQEASGTERRQQVEFILLNRPQSCDDGPVQIPRSKPCVLSR